MKLELKLPSITIPKDHIPVTSTTIMEYYEIRSSIRPTKPFNFSS